MKTLFRKKAPAIWSFNDPKPGFNYIGTMMGKVKNKLNR